MAAPEAGFALGIIPQLDGNGNIVGYQVKSESRGLSQEIIMTLLRNWLRASEDDYFKKFIGKSE